MRQLNLVNYSELYQITEDGRLYSNRKQRFLKGSVNNFGYKMYYLVSKYPIKNRWYFAHILTALTYIGEQPVNTAVNHIDGNRLNNHYSNLEFVMHSENVRKSYLDGKRVRNKLAVKMSEETRRKIAESKYKKVSAYNILTNVTINYNSVQELCTSIPGMNRKKFNKIVKGNCKSNYIFIFY